MSSLLIVFLAVLAAAGAFVACAALMLPAADPAEIATMRSGGFVIRNPRPHPLGFRARVDRTFNGIVERGNRRRVKNTGLTLAEHLSRADLKLRSSEFVMIQLAFLVGFALLGLLRFGFGPQFVFSGVGGYLLPMRYVRYRQRRRMRKFNSQLPETVGLLSNGLKAGFSLTQAMDSVAHNAAPPLSEELARVIREMNMGSSLEQALQNMVKRIASDDMDLIVTAILIHNQVGGNLARILDSISYTIRQRVQVKAQVSALTAQARASGWIITLLPAVVASLLYVIAPSYFRAMTTDPIGIFLLTLAGILIVIGNLFIRRITNIKV